MVLRMAQGECLINKDSETFFSLGIGQHERDKIDQKIVQTLVNEQLAKMIFIGTTRLIVLTEQANNWLIKRGLKARIITKADTNEFSCYFISSEQNKYIKKGWKLEERI